MFLAGSKVEVGSCSSNNKTFFLPPEQIFDELLDLFYLAWLK
jgi:hypothetical protein